MKTHTFKTFFRSICHSLNSTLLVLIVILVNLVSPSRGETQPQLMVEIESNRASFELTVSDTKKFWRLQSSSDGFNWVGFRDITTLTGDKGNLLLEVGFEELPSSEQGNGFFRAIELTEREIFVRRIAEQKEIWEREGSDDYEYELNQYFGEISWRGSVTVAGGNVSSFLTIDLQPSFVGVPRIPTIDGLFDQITHAISVNAATIEVTWDPVYGYPTSCFIDFDIRIADEEIGWTIESYTVSE